MTKEIDKADRLMFVDIARGICMISIVLGHLGEPNINRFVFTYHLPVFYLISGYFFDCSSPFLLFIKKKIRTLIIPYYFASLLILLSSIIISRFILVEKYDINSLYRWIKAILYASGDNWTEPFEIPGIGALWFLWATFWGCVLLRFIIKFKPSKQAFVVLLLFFVGKWTCDNLFLFPLAVQPACCALLYMYLGYLVRKTNIKELPVEIKYIIIAISTWMWISFIQNFQGFWLVHCNIGRGISDIIGSVCASLIIFLISYIISKHFILLSKLLGFLGRYSVMVLCAHIVELNTFPYWMFENAILGDVQTPLKCLYLRIIIKFIWIVFITIIFSKVSFFRYIFGMKKVNNE